MEALFDDKYSFCNIHQLCFNSRHYPPDCRSAFLAVNVLESESASKLCLAFFKGFSTMGVVGVFILPFLPGL